MTRSICIEYPDALYHVVSRGVAKRDIYCCDEDRRMFLRILKRAVRAHNLVIHAYCLMGNHYHLLVQTPDANLSRGMHAINGDYAQTHNRIHERAGHLFQGRYSRTLIEKEGYLLAAARYIVLNPVRAGLTDNPAHYPWSSYPYTAGLFDPPDFMHIDGVLSFFCKDLLKAQDRYRRFVFQGITEDVPTELEGEAFLGSKEFISGLQDMTHDKREIKDIPRRQRFPGRPGLHDIFPQNDPNKEERNRRIIVAFREFGYLQREIARHLRLSDAAVSQIIKGSIEGLG